MNKRRNPLVAACLVIIAFASFLGSCASAPARAIKTDSGISGTPGKALIAYRIRATSRTLRNEYLPYLVLDALGQRSPVSSTIKPSGVKRDFWSGRIIEGGWKEDGGVAKYEELIFVEAKPGFYHLKELYQLLSSESYSSYSYGGTTTTTVTKWLDEKIDFGVDVKAGQCRYIGTIDMNCELEKDNSFSYRYSIQVDDEIMASDLSSMRRAYPKLYAAYRSSIQSARLFHYQDLNQVTGSEGVHKGYIRKADADGAIASEPSIWGPSVPAGIPFMVEWRSFWKEGEKDRPYGVYLGRNTNDAWLFGITEDKRAVVMRLLDGNIETGMLDAKTEGIKPGLDRRENVCRVEFRDGKAGFFVNGILAGTFACEPDFSGGISGIFTVAKGLFDIRVMTLRELVAE